MRQVDVEQLACSTHMLELSHTWCLMIAKCRTNSCVGLRPNKGPCMTSNGTTHGNKLLSAGVHVLLLSSVN